TGLVTAHGLLHGPGSGRNLTNADNLNSTTFASGEYWIQSSASLPANMPPGVSVGGRVRISHAPGGVAGTLQQFFPFPTNTNYSHAHSRMWWRFHLSSGWTPWRSTSVSGNGISMDAAGVMTTAGLLHGVPGSG